MTEGDAFRGQRMGDYYIAIVLLFLLGLLGGLIPLLVRRNDRLLHAALALATGIFLGAVFLHLLPALGTPHVHGHGVGAHAEGGASTVVWTFVLLGVVGVYLIEALFFRSHGHDDLHRHRSVGYAAIVGLSVHALTEGIGLAAASTQEDLATPFLMSVGSHKLFESFSLCSVFLLAHFSRKKILTLIVLFSLVTPAGIIVGGLLTTNLGPLGISLLTALAAGTFLYVCLCELLPEVFHHREDILAKILLLGGGVVLMHYFQELGL